MSFDYRGDKKPSTQLEAPTSSFMANGDQKPLVVDTIPDDSDVRSVSSDIDNERVREKLKKTTIAPASSRSSSWAKMADEDETMDSANDTTEEGKRRARKRSHDESDEEKVEGDDGKQRRRQKAHERKRSREILEQDRIRAGSGLERVKTPPTHIEESDAIAERVSSPKGLERKRSLGKLDKEDDADQKKKITKTEEERQESQELENKTESEIADDNMKDKVELKLPQNSGFANTSSKSPFATAASGPSIFGSGNSSASLFANSKFGALSGSSTSPFGNLGSKNGSQSPFGALGTKSPPLGFASTFGASMFGGNTFGSGAAFGASAGKSSQSKRPFGAPDDDDQSDDDDDGSDDEDDEKHNREVKGDDGTIKPLGLKEQEVMTGEENEITVFKCGAKVFTFNKEEKAWKERGRGTLKLNRTMPQVDDFGVTSENGTEEKKPAKQSARLILRTDRTYVVVLNCPIYKGMNLGDLPKANQLNFLAVEATGPVPIVLRVGKLETAKELYQHITDLQTDLWG